MRWSFAFGVTLAGFFYGCLHALAWNAPFQSATQAVLWRVSAISLIASGPVYIAMILAGRAATYSRGLEEWIDACIVLVLPVVFGYMTLVRTFLVVECFLNLAHSPKAVYTSIQWSEYFPHFG
jgi:hypothetical protein